VFLETEGCAPDVPCCDGPEASGAVATVRRRYTGDEALRRREMVSGGKTNQREIGSGKRSRWCA